MSMLQLQWMMMTMIIQLICSHNNNPINKKQVSIQLLNSSRQVQSLKQKPMSNKWKIEKVLDTMSSVKKLTSLSLMIPNKWSRSQSSNLFRKRNPSLSFPNHHPLKMPLLPISANLTSTEHSVSSELTSSTMNIMVTANEN